MDAISLIKQDHRAVNELFDKFEAMGPRATKTKRTTVDKIVKELSIHAAIEENVLYPFIRENVPDLEDTILEALEEHLVVKWELAALADMDPTDERFDAKTMVLMESVRHHVKEEEREVLPELRRQVPRSELQSLGEQLERAKKTAPTRPTSDGMMDRARTLGMGAVERMRERV